MAKNARERSPFSDMVAAQIRAERAAADETQEQVYEAAGLARSTYLRIEKGERVADMSQLERILNVLGVSLSDFFRRVEERMRDGEAPVPMTATVPQDDSVAVIVTLGEGATPEQEAEVREYLASRGLGSVTRRADH